MQGREARVESGEYAGKIRRRHGQANYGATKCRLCLGIVMPLGAIFQSIYRKPGSTGFKVGIGLVAQLGASGTVEQRHLRDRKEAKDATTVTITAEDESHDMKLKDGKLILEEDDGNLVFTKSDKDLSGTVKKDREAAEKEEEIDEAVEDDDVQNVEISPAVTVADDDLCTITITEKFKDDWGDIGFVVNITNKSDKDLTFYAPSGKTNVNGTMKEPWFSANLMPGTSATEEFTFSSGELDSLDDLVNTTIGIDAYLTDSYEDVASYSATIA